MDVCPEADILYGLLVLGTGMWCCAEVCGRITKGVAVADGPDWMRKRNVHYFNFWTIISRSQMKLT